MMVHIFGFPLHAINTLQVLYFRLMTVITSLIFSEHRLL